MRILIGVLLLCSCAVEPTEVSSESQVRSPSVPTKADDVVASAKLVHVVEKSAKLDKIVNNWRGAELFSRGCSIAEASADKADRCSDEDQNRAETQAADISECLRCAGYHDPETDLEFGDAEFGVCHTFCGVKKLPFTSADRFGCTCGGKTFYWSRDRCRQEPCETYGFMWVTEGASGYWTVKGS